MGDFHGKPQVGAILIDLVRERMSHQMISQSDLEGLKFQTKAWSQSKKTKLVNKTGAAG
jgi:hypothetical protein